MDITLELFNAWSGYVKRTGDNDIEAFCLDYISRKSFEHHKADDYGMPLESQLAGLLGRLNRFSTQYSRKALKHVGLNNLEEWLFLISMIGLGSPKKSELIHEMITEFPSGIQVINRLMKKGLLKEFRDEEDKRAKRVRITENGEKVLRSSMNEMNKVSAISFGPISNLEKQMLLKILRKLDSYHTEHYNQTKELDFGVLDNYFMNN